MAQPLSHANHAARLAIPRHTVVPPPQPLGNALHARDHSSPCRTRRCTSTCRPCRADGTSLRRLGCSRVQPERGQRRIGPAVRPRRAECDRPSVHGVVDRGARHESGLDRVETEIRLERPCPAGPAGQVVPFFGGHHAVNLVLGRTLVKPFSRDKAGGKSYIGGVPVLEGREQVLQACDRACWNLTEAAALLGVSRQAVYNALARWQIPRHPSTEPDEIVSARAKRSIAVRWAARRRSHRGRRVV